MSISRSQNEAEDERHAKWEAEIRNDEREKCAAVLGKEVLRLLGCRDREDAEGIARAASMLRALPPNSAAGGEK